MSDWTIKRAGKIVPGRYDTKQKAEEAIAQMRWRDAVPMQLEEPKEWR